MLAALATGIAFVQAVHSISTAQVRRALGGSLSNSTTIFGAGNGAYINATHRWDSFAVPEAKVVIEVGAESDVSKIVCMPFILLKSDD